MKGTDYIGKLVYEQFKKLEYEKFKCLGQWRNSGKGAAWYELLDDDGNVIGGNLA